MPLHVGGTVSYDGIADRVGFVECVGCKVQNLVIDAVGNGLGYTALHRAGNAAFCYVAECLVTVGRRLQTVMEKARRIAVELQHALPPRGVLVAVILRLGHARTPCEEGYSVTEFEIFDLHDEVDHAAALAAAEAVIDLLVRRYGEGGGLFAVEGADAEDVCAGALGEVDVAAHDLLDGVALCQFLQIVFGYGHASHPLVICSSVGVCLLRRPYFFDVKEIWKRKHLRASALKKPKGFQVIALTRFVSRPAIAGKTRRRTP